MAISAEAYEKLAAFYLGHRTEPGREDHPVLYDAKDLTTHGLCVGMTGSGKTGLCISLLEEAAIDGIGAICIDPKGDLGNLMLTFPELRPEDFAPWIDPGDAARHGRTADEHAAVVAKQWRDGLARSGQDGSRIARLRATTDVVMFTPGSASGRPLSLLGSLAPPGPGTDADATRERIDGTVSGLLSLLDLEADPMQSREHILLSLILDATWKEGRSLDLGALIRAVMEPPVTHVGVLDLETFFSAKDRQKLALRLNNLLASPSFAAWMEGEPLDVDRLLRSPDGKPRISILSIAHLSDRERMFFVTSLLGEVLTWMRRQPGTSSLRALLYMDEVFGFFPPVSEPPSKRIMLTLLKQARAFGLGILLSTQNPVDLDYKGLSNCGTWMLGRLQTQRDLDRVLDGLEGAGADGFDRRAVEAEIAGMPGRQFYLHNVHEPEPVRFRTRWALCYLRGPLTREQTAALCQPADAPPSPALAHAGATPAPLGTAAPASPPAQTAPRPILSADIEELFLAPVSTGPVTYQPHLLATVSLHYTHRHAELDRWLEPTLVVPFPAGKKARVDWKGAAWQRLEHLALGGAPVLDAAFGPLGPLDDERVKKFEKELKDHLYRHESMPVFYCRPLRMWSQYGEGAAQLTARVELVLREKRDLELEKLRTSYAPKLQRIEERIRNAQQKVEQQKAQQRYAGFGAALDVGATVVGSIFGRQRYLSGAKQAMRGAARTARERGDVERAEEDVTALRQELLDLERALEDETNALTGAGLEAPVEQKKVKPTKSDIGVSRLALLWRPVHA